jgi:hypothetical protein
VQNKTKRQWSAFVVMPLSDEFSWVFDDLIAPALREANYHAVRADSVVDQQNIMRDIVEGVIRCDLVIAEITSLNPNVMYELGMAHALRRPTLILTQDTDSAPFDLRAYRLIPYSDNYREMDRVKSTLIDIATKHRNGEVSFSSPVNDFAPPEFWSNELPQPAITSAMEVGQAKPEYEGRPGLLDREQQIAEQFVVIATQAVRLGEITEDFLQNAQTRVEAMEEIGEVRSPEAYKRARAALGSIASLMVRWSEDMEAQLPPVRQAWKELEESADEFVTEASIDSEDDRKAAEQFVSTMDEFQLTVHDSVQQLTEAKNSLPPLRRISRELDRAGHRAEQSLNAVIDSISAGEPFAARLANIVRSRLDADSEGPLAKSTK